MKKSSDPTKFRRFLSDRLLEHVEHWERIASRGRPAFSSHLICGVLVNLTSPDSRGIQVSANAVYQYLGH